MPRPVAESSGTGEVEKRQGYYNNKYEEEKSIGDYHPCERLSHVDKMASC